MIDNIVQSPLYLFTNATVSASAERLIWTICAFADSTKSKVDLFAIFVHVGFERLSSNTFWVTPPRWIPDVSVGPNLRVNLADSGRSKNEVTLGNYVGFIIGRCGERGRNCDVSPNITHNTVNGWVHTEGFTDDRIEDGELAEFFIGHLTEGPIRIAKAFNLFLVKSLSTGKDQCVPVAFENNQTY